ncbi:MAG TPA: barstar family protein, partial [Chitinophagaceae bacterium]|nr:barstar family protein [Chitinophagaceae bacterium]
MAVSNFYTEGHIRYVFIDGSLCDTMEKIYATLKAQLSLPDYFGNNLDALSDVLSDLEWVKEKKVKLIIVNKDALLQNEKNKKSGFLS